MGGKGLVDNQDATHITFRHEIFRFAPEDKVIQALEDQGEDDPKVAHIALNGKIEDDKSEKCQFCIT